MNIVLREPFDFYREVGSRMDGLRPFLRQLSRGCVTLETGRLNSHAPGYRIGHGWSTAVIAAEVTKLGGTFISIDNDPKTAIATMDVLSARIAQCMTLITADSVDAIQNEVPGILGPRKLDFVLLDSAASASLMVDEYTALLPHFSASALLALDDSDESKEEQKGSILKLLLIGMWTQLRFQDPVVFIRGQVEVR